MKKLILGYRHPSIKIERIKISKKRKFLAGGLIASSLLFPDAGIGAGVGTLIASPIGVKKTLRNKYEDISDYAKRKYHLYKK